MSNTFLLSAKRLGDAELIATLKSLASRERATTAELVAHLVELESRELHLAAGYSSMFAYCCDALGLSEHEAYNRIEVARAARRFPIVLDRLVAGDVTLTTVRLLAPHLTAENHLAVLAASRGLRRREVEVLAARLAPRPDAPTVIRRLPADRSPTTATHTATALAPSPTSPQALPNASTGSETVAAPEFQLDDGGRQLPTLTSVALATAPRSPAAHAQPLAPDRYRLQVMIPAATFDKLQLAKDLLRHALPTGDDAEILDRALTALLTDLAKNKFAATAAPRPATGDGARAANRQPSTRGSAPATTTSHKSNAPRPGAATTSRHVPADVKRAVFLRDMGRCAYRGSGRRCGERAFIEFHHVHPHAHGGAPTVDNLELRCRRHNAYEWRRESTKLREAEDRMYEQRCAET